MDNERRAETNDEMAQITVCHGTYSSLLTDFLAFYLQCSQLNHQTLEGIYPRVLECHMLKM